MRETRTQLAFAAQAGSADYTACGQSFQSGVVIGNKGIARIFTLTDASQHKTLRQVHRHVLQRMHGNVGAAVFQRGFQFFHEQTLATYFGQRDIQDLIALRGHAQDADYSLWV